MNAKGPKSILIGSQLLDDPGESQLSNIVIGAIMINQAITLPMRNTLGDQMFRLLPFVFANFASSFAFGSDRVIHASHSSRRR